MTVTDALETYLNDHLGGSMLGSDLADQLCDRTEGTTLGNVLARLAPEIAADRDSLAALMAQLGARQNPVKQAGAWVAEKSSRVKLGKAAAVGDRDLALFMALEILTLGVAGKRSLWRALQLAADAHPELDDAELARLLARAEAQHEALEDERVAMAGRLFGASGG